METIKDYPHLEFVGRNKRLEELRKIKKKMCSGCSNIYPEEFFNLSSPKKSKTKRRAECKNCLSDIQRQRYLNKKSKSKSQSSEHTDE